MRYTHAADLLNERFRGHLPCYDRQFAPHRMLRKRASWRRPQGAGRYVLKPLYNRDPCLIGPITTGAPPLCYPPWRVVFRACVFWLQNLGSNRFFWLPGGGGGLCHPHLCLEWHCFVCGMSENDDICLSLLLETFEHFVHCCDSARIVHVM